MSEMTQRVPTVRGAFLLGSLPAFRHARFAFQLDVMRSYGDLARARLGVFHVLMASSQAWAQAVLVSQEDAFAKSLGLSLFARPLLGEGLLTSEGARHRRQRRLLAPAYLQRRIAQYAAVMVERAERGVQRMLASRDVELSEHTTQTTLEIVGKTLFDAELSDKATEVGGALTEAMECMATAMTAVLPLPPAVPTPGNRRLQRAVSRLDGVVYAMIRARRQDPHDRGDLLSILLSARDEDDGTGMTDLEVRDEAMTAFLAGHETTANALAWALILLAQHPDAHARAEAEVDALFADKSDPRASLDVSDLPRLPYMLQVVKEAMRLYPPAYLIGRRVVKNVHVLGQDLRKHQVVFINVAGLHRHPELHAEPDRFDPDRFLPEREKALPRHAFMPFGAGPRMCIGNHFALMEAQLVLATWLRRARFELSVPGQTFACESLITLRPKGAVRMRVTARS